MLGRFALLRSLRPNSSIAYQCIMHASLRSFIIDSPDTPANLPLFIPPLDGVSGQLLSMCVYPPRAFHPSIQPTKHASHPSIDMFQNLSGTAVNSIPLGATNSARLSTQTRPSTVSILASTQTLRSLLPLSPGASASSGTALARTT